MASAIDSEPIQARRIIVKNFATRKGENYEECKQVGFYLQSQKFLDPLRLSGHCQKLGFNIIFWWYKKYSESHSILR